jgi:hypothetical protein
VPWAAALVLAVLLASCGGAGGDSGTSGTRLDSRVVISVAAGERSVDVGGYRLFLACRGHGAPTVILAAGYATTSSVWEVVRSRFPRPSARARMTVRASAQATIVVSPSLMPR